MESPEGGRGMHRVVATFSFCGKVVMIFFEKKGKGKKKPKLDADPNRAATLDDGTPPLYCASTKGHTDVVLALLQAGLLCVCVRVCVRAESIQSLREEFRTRHYRRFSGPSLFLLLLLPVVRCAKRSPTTQPADHFFCFWATPLVGGPFIFLSFYRKSF